MTFYKCINVQPLRLCFLQDSIVEKTDTYTFIQDDKTLPINSTVYKENIVSSLSESLKQQIADGSMDVQPFYKNDRPYFPAASLHMKLNSRYISKVWNDDRQINDCKMGP